MTVYVMHEPRLDIFDMTPAEKFGDIVPVFSTDFAPGFYPKEAYATAETWASGFNFENDYIVVAGGDPVAGMIALSALTKVAIEENETEVNFLRYTRRRYRKEGGYDEVSDYTPVKLRIA